MDPVNIINLGQLHNQTHKRENSTELHQFINNNLEAENSDVIKLKSAYLFRQTLNSDLLHVPKGESRVAFQAAKYHEIYDTIMPIYESNKPEDSIDLYNTLHIPGLQKILENGFALTIDHVLSQTHLSQSEKLDLLKKIKELYSISLTLEANNVFSQRRFADINYFLALIAEKSKHGYKIESYKFQILDDIKKNLSNTIFKANYLCIHVNEKKYNLFQPYIFIYGNPLKRTNIAPDSFVHQLLDYKYRSHILLFDVATPSFLGVQSKKDAHYSNFNPTNEMLSHDHIHYGQIISSEFDEELLEQKGMNKILSEIKDRHQEINQLRKKFNKNSNEYKVLTRALFILIHENPAINNIKTDLDNIKDAILNELKDNNAHIRDEAYKINFRDMEYILREKSTADQNLKYKSLTGIDDKPFLPENFKEFNDYEKQKAVLNGYAAFWDYVKAICQSKSK